MEDKAVVFDNVSFSYGRKRIIENFSLSVNKGERICVFGSSGAGKSTLLRLICGLEKPNSGKIFVYSKNIRPVFQDDRLLPFLTLSQNVAMFSNGKDTDGIISSLGLEEAKNEYPSKLSGGMARRTAVARAIADEGDIYIFDEIFNGLDEENTDKAIKLINKNTLNKTVICVLHNKEHAVKLGCKIVEMKKLF